MADAHQRKFDAVLVWKIIASEDHSSIASMQKYSKTIDEYRRDAVRKLEQLRAAHAQHGTISASVN